jgi:hypothetical protein
MLVNKKINLAQLDQELNGQGLNATLNDSGVITEVKLANNNNATEAQLEAAIATHIALDEAEANAMARAELLARLNITAEEVKLLLIGN